MNHQVKRRKQRDDDGNESLSEGGEVSLTLEEAEGSELPSWTVYTQCHQIRIIPPRQDRNYEVQVFRLNTSVKRTRRSNLTSFSTWLSAVILQGEGEKVFAKQKKVICAKKKT
jgi:hypothetical protein